jgi:hypothetical protein
MKGLHAQVSQDTRRVQIACRDKIDVLRSRVKLLTGRDRLLLTMYLDKGNSFREMARLAGVNETIIARRVRKMMKRLIDGPYITCLRNHDRFTGTEMAIAKDRFLTGLAIRKIARRRHLTYYCVRKTLKHIERIITTVKQQEI